MTNPTLSRVWGNPAAPTYRKKNIRKITAGGEPTYIHRELQDLAVKLADAAGLPLEGWKAPGKDEQDHPRHYGIAVRAGVEIPEAAQFGFVPDGDGWYVFSGTPAQAKDQAEALEAARMQERVQGEPAFEHEWGTKRPGERELQMGDKGDDVQFFQMTYAAPDQTGIFDEWCEAMAKVLQGRWGARITGRVDENLWKGILPTALTYSISYGDSGHVVRVLQSALVAYDWDRNVIVTGRFDDVTHKALRHLQADYGLRQSSEVTAAEWTILLGRPPRNITP